MTLLADLIVEAQQRPTDYGPALVALIGSFTTLVAIIGVILQQWWGFHRAQLERDSKAREIKGELRVVNDAKTAALERIEHKLNGNLDAKLDKRVEQLKEAIVSPPGSDTRIPASIKTLRRIASSDAPEAELAKRILAELESDTPPASN